MKVTSLLLVFLPSILSFNISPYPNIIIRKPTPSNVIKPQNRSSYFGYSINLRENHILIGAPRSQPLIERQRELTEPGALFKCSLQDDSYCQPYQLDMEGNTFGASKFTIDSEYKDNQMLGFAMDGHEGNSDRFAVCAPNQRAFATDEYNVYGVCYWVQGTQANEPDDIQKISPLRVRKKQKIDDQYYFMYGQSGFSVHITDDNEEIIIGCPGILNWKGSVIRHRKQQNFNTHGMSKRDVTSHTDLLFDEDIPSPFYAPASITNDSYFGYAVSSANFLGTKSNELFYIASAPQANNQTGLVYIFNITVEKDSEKVNVVRNVSGMQFGEYFGYTLLTEDFNNDGYPDLVISAPLYSKNKIHENGAVYIFINKGNFNFDQQDIITSEFSGNGRFGTTLAKIGDINLDGYNDLAVSAPFEDNGVVYIFLGSGSGLSSKPSQRIEAPSELPNAFGESKSYFGHGMSRGVDIDGNEYKDIAIGSPNAESVYVFKTYPWIKVIGSITPSKTELTLKDSSISFELCAHIESTKKINREIEFITTLELDANHRRASFQGSNKNIEINNMKLMNAGRCKKYHINIQGNLEEIFKPILVDMKFELLEKIPANETKFCDTCFVLNPHDFNSISKNITFRTGCKETKCITDLAVVGKLSNAKNPYAFNSTDTIDIIYEIQNYGEPAYYSQINITIPTNITKFRKTPPTCQSDHDVLSCNITSSNPIRRDEPVQLKISLETSHLRGELLSIHANVFSRGDDKNPRNNRHQFDIRLMEYSEIELNGKSSVSQLSFEDGLRTENIQFTYNIFNKGPSTIKMLYLSLQFPTSYMLEQSYNIINPSNTSIRGFYEDEELLGNKTSERKMNYLQYVTVEEENSIVKNLDRDRTIFFDCFANEAIRDCVNIDFILENFPSGNEPITINMNFSIDLKHIFDIFKGNKNVFLFRPNTFYQRAGVADLTSLSVYKKSPFVVIYEKMPLRIPWWLWILSIIFGIALLAAISYFLYKKGFFRRAKKEELKRLSCAIQNSPSGEPNELSRLNVES